MTQEIKIILTFKEKEYLNIKSSEVIHVLKKVIHVGSESIMFSVSGNPVRIPAKLISRDCNSPTAPDSATERNNSRKIINGELPLICTL
jgi:hypothetical protein